MMNINFVPDDYVQDNESRRTNLLYLILFVVVMSSLTGVFLTIKLRQRAFNIKEELVNQKVAKAKEDMRQFEQLQEKRKQMMRTALVTTELLEPVPRSVLLASLTNNLPAGASLLKVNLVQKKPAGYKENTQTKSKYQKANNKESLEHQMSQEKLLETYIDIEGIAPSDLQVATYIEKLGDSNLVNNVALVESKERIIDEITYRQFKLKAMLNKQNVHL